MLFLSLSFGRSTLVGTASYETTLVRLSAHPSATKSSQIGSLGFSDIVHDDS